MPCCIKNRRGLLPAAEDPIDSSPTPDEIKDLNGFSLFGDAGAGVGIGPVNASRIPPDPYYHSSSGSWLIARIDYLVGTAPGQSEIFLQIGSRGISHCSAAPCSTSSTADTAVVFGASTDPRLNAGHTAPGFPGQRDMDSLTSDATFFINHVIVPKADFDANSIADQQDLKIWQGSYGAGGGGDADGDGDTDGRDFLAWQRLFNGGGSSLEIPGDFDGDNDVDGRDFLAWQRGNSPSPLSAADLVDWQANYGVSSPLAENKVVPEPNALILMILAAVTRLIHRSCRIGFPHPHFDTIRTMKKTSHCLIPFHALLSSLLCRR